MRRPLKITLSLVAISADAVKAFQEICRDIILYRERRGLPAATTASEWENVSAKRLANIKAALELCGPEGHARITDKEAQRIYGHIVALQNAEVPLKRVEVKTE